MDKSLIKIGAFAAGFWYLFLRGASALKIGLKKIELVSFSMSDLTLQITLYINNPLLAAVFIRAISGDVSIMGQPVGKINSLINKRIKARSTTYIPVQVTMNNSALGEATMMNIISGSVETLTVEFDGWIVAGEKVTVPFPVKRLWTYDDIIENNAQ